MRIVDRATLLTQPMGTLFAEAFEPGRYGDLCIYGGVFGPDFTERCIRTCTSDSAEQLVDREEAMWSEGSSFPVEDGYGREGYFDDSLRYLVYEPADVQSIIRGLNGLDGTEQQ